jgi:hypothetical protein
MVAKKQASEPMKRKNLDNSMHANCLINRISLAMRSRIENKRKRPNLLHRNRLQAKSEVKKKVGRGRFAGGGFIRSKTGLSLLLGG